MRYSFWVAATALSALALSACDRPTVVAPAPPPVVVTVPGPTGPQGSQGAQGVPGAEAEKGATGATGMPGSEGAKGEQGSGAIVIVPAPAPATQR